jgi:hypothetical protein
VIEYFPLTQCKQFASESLPIIYENLPAGHRSQSVSSLLPCPAANLPPTQSTHVSTPVAPSTVEYFPAAQMLHVKAPVYTGHSCQQGYRSGNKNSCFHRSQRIRGLAQQQKGIRGLEPPPHRLCRCTCPLHRSDRLLRSSHPLPLRTCRRHMTGSPTLRCCPHWDIFTHICHCSSVHELYINLCADYFVLWNLCKG